MLAKNFLRLILCAVVIWISCVPCCAYDYVSGVQEMSHLYSSDVKQGAYVAPWYDADSSNYFAFMACWDSGLVVIRTTDPQNPQYVTTFYGPPEFHLIQDVKVIGNYAYVADFGWGSSDSARNLYILPLKSEYPYYDSSAVVTIPFKDNASTSIGVPCDTIPLFGDHTLFAAGNYLYISEDGSDAYKEIAILDVSSGPLRPTLAGLIDSTDVEFGFNGAHSVCAVGDTIYASEWLTGIYKLVVDPNDGFDVLSWGKILYDSWRRDVENNNPLLGMYEDSLWVIDLSSFSDPCFPCTQPCTCWTHYCKPGSHSNYVAPNGYLLACDEDNYGWDYYNQVDTLAAILRVFKTTDFSTALDTVPVYGAFDVVWKSSLPYLQYSTEISEMDGNWPPGSSGQTPCPPNFGCDTLQFAYMDLGIHDVTVKGRLAFAAYYGNGTHILDVSDPTNIRYRGGIAHNRAPTDTWNENAYAICLSKDGYIYQSGYSTGLYIYRYGLTGTISADTTWSSDVYLYNTLTVTSGHRLELEAGTHVYLFKDALLKVEGTLVANGTSSDSVIFSVLGGDPQPGDWQGILLAFDAACSLSYCCITNAEIGVEMQSRAHANISHCNISHNSMAGVYNWKGDLRLGYSQVNYNDIYGLYSYFSDDSVYNSHFVEDGEYGIYLDDAQQPASRPNKRFRTHENVDCISPDNFTFSAFFP